MTNAELSWAVGQPVKVCEVRALLKIHMEEGLAVSERLLVEIERPGKLFMVTLKEEPDFLRLVWQSNEQTKALAPVGQPRTLRDCASRIPRAGFRGLINDGNYWFKKCVEIDEGFDHSKLGLIALTPLIESERSETPMGTWYIFDGVHRAIVLARRLLARQFQYRPLGFLLLTPRRK